ncbi:MAG: thioredoxin domain-containing protein [Bacteroidota bacterium]
MKKRNIYLNKKEFAFQYESHPEFPSLLALSDTLRFFNVKNDALHVQASEIDNLPSFFITKLKHSQDDELTFIEAKNTDQYTVYQTSNTHTISKNTLLQKWLGIVFLIDTNDKNPKKKVQLSWKHVLLLGCIVSFVGLCTPHFQTLPYFILFALPAIGLAFSIAALKSVFHLHHTFLDTICGSQKTTDCTHVIHAENQFSILSDVSLVFFGYQLLAFIIFAATNTFPEYVAVEKVVLIGTVPVILFSLYYQFVVVKKLCVLCLSISTIILIELTYVSTLPNVIAFEHIAFSEYNFHIFLFGLLAFGWYSLKAVLTANQHLVLNQIEANRFKRNYTIFRNTLISTSNIVAPPTSLIFGNPKAKLTLDFITNPYCHHCKEPYKLLKRCLENYPDQITVRMIYNVNLKQLDEKAVSLTQHLYHIHEMYGTETFFEALDFWYATENHKQWFEKYHKLFDTTKIRHKLKTHRTWCLSNAISFTPALYINGYAFPKSYALTELNYFIDELVEDVIT